MHSSSMRTARLLTISYSARVGLLTSPFDIDPPDAAPPPRMQTPSEADPPGGRRPYEQNDTQV